MAVYVMAADGSQVRRVTQDSEPALAMGWSPDGNTILYVRGPLAWRSELAWNVFRWEIVLGQPELWVVGLDGAASRRLMSEPQDACEVIWSPDREWIAFTSRRQGDLDIYVSTPDGNAPFNVTSDFGSDITPSWSPRSVSAYIDQLPPGAAAEPDGADTVVFRDPALDAVVRAHVGRLSGLLTRSEVDSITGLAARGQGITDLGGTEALRRLKYLWLTGGQIRDLGPLAGLSTLRWLVLDDNQIADLQPLSGLRGLEQLSLNGNDIGDVTPLSGLTRLRYLLLSFNQIHDLSPLAQLKPLHPGIYGFSLALAGNPVTDLSPVLEIPYLRHLKLRGCPLDDYSRNTVIPTLKGRGVDVVQ